MSTDYSISTSIKVQLKPNKRESDLMMDPLINLLLVVQDHEGLGRKCVTGEDEAQISSLTLHICEID